MNLKLDCFYMCPKCKSRVPKRYFKQLSGTNISSKTYSCPVCYCESILEELVDIGIKKTYADFDEYIFRALSKEEAERIRDFLIENHEYGEGICQMTGDAYEEDQDMQDSKVITTVSAVELDPIWCFQQPWYNEVCRHVGDKDVKPPKYVIRMGFSGNYGQNVLLDEEFDPWDTEEVLTGNAPAYQGCYGSNDRREIIKWICELVIFLRIGHIIQYILS
jgi:hypothetical protein